MERRLSISWLGFWHCSNQITQRIAGQSWLLLLSETEFYWIVKLLNHRCGCNCNCHCFCCLSCQLPLLLLLFANFQILFLQLRIRPGCLDPPTPLLGAQRTLGRFFHFMSHVISHDVGSRHTAGQADAAVLADFGCHSLHSILEPGVLQLATCDLQLATCDLRLATLDSQTVEAACLCCLPLKLPIQVGQVQSRKCELPASPGGPAAIYVVLWANCSVIRPISR